MIPLKDNIPCRTVPVVNWLMIGLCTLVFLAQVQEGVREPSLVERFGMIPLRITRPSEPVKVVVYEGERPTRFGEQREVTTREAAPPGVPAVLTLLTCVFLHGGWMHFLGNMWFLHIFGDNVEDRFGHFGYALFYLAGGVAASLMHLVTAPFSEIPTIGASGAIAAVMGAYFVWYPHAYVKAAIPVFVLQIVVLPASVFLGFWFLLQFFQGTASILGTEASGVAWWAHIGGFAFGAALAWFLGKTPLTSPKNTAIRPGEDHVSSYRSWPTRRS